MFGGKLIKASRKTIPGTYRQLAYQDVWQDSMDIEYDGELTPEVQAAITQAFYRSQSCQKAESGYGRLRWSSGDSVSHVDLAQRQLIINCGCRIAD